MIGPQNESSLEASDPTKLCLEMLWKYLLMSVLGPPRILCCVFVCVVCAFVCAFVCVYVSGVKRSVWYGVWCMVMVVMVVMVVSQKPP